MIRLEAFVSISAASIAALGVCGIIWIDSNRSAFNNFIEPGRAELMRRDLEDTGGANFERIADTRAFLVSMRISAEELSTKTEALDRAKNHLERDTGCSVDLTKEVSVLQRMRPSFIDKYVMTVACPPDRELPTVS